VVDTSTAVVDDRGWLVRSTVSTPVRGNNVAAAVGRTARRILGLDTDDAG
jgi:hypothetical protein